MKVTSRSGSSEKRLPRIGIRTRATFSAERKTPRSRAQCKKATKAQKDAAQKKMESQSDVKKAQEALKQGSEHVATTGAVAAVVKSVGAAQQAVAAAVAAKPSWLFCAARRSVYAFTTRKASAAATIAELGVEGSTPGPYSAAKSDVAVFVFVCVTFIPLNPCSGNPSDGRVLPSTPGMFGSSRRCSYIEARDRDCAFECTFTPVRLSAVC